MEFPEPRLCRAELVAAAPLSPRVRSLSVAVRGPEEFRWIAGQYVEVGMIGEQAPRQPYSIASAPDPDDPGSFELAVGSGSGGGVLDELAIGESLEVFGPCGKFVRPAADALPEVFIGTGTGLAPLRAMLQVALAAGGGAPLLLLFGCRSESEMLWRVELEELSVREPRLCYVPTLTRPTESWHGRTGRVQNHLPELLAPLPDARIYVCGVAEMVEDCVRLLTNDLGYPTERVLSEKH